MAFEGFTPYLKDGITFEKTVGGRADGMRIVSNWLAQFAIRQRLLGPLRTSRYVENKDISLCPEISIRTVRLPGHGKRWEAFDYEGPAVNELVI